MLMLGGIDQGWRDNCGWAQPPPAPGVTPHRAPAAPSRVHPGARSDGEVGKEVGTPPKVLQAHFCFGAWVGGLKGRAMLRAGGSALAPSAPGWLVPAAPQAALQLRQLQRGEGAAQHRFPCPALHPRANPAPSALPDVPQDPHPHRAEPCSPRSCPHTLPSPCGPALAGCSASAGPARAMRGGGVWSQRAHPVPGHRCGDAADGRRYRHWHEAPAALPPSPGAPSLRDASGDPRDREGAIPTHSRAGVCPCGPWPQLPRDWQNPQSSWVVDRSHVSAAAMARQQWKMAKNVGLDLTRLEPAGPGLQALSPQRGN